MKPSIWYTAELQMVENRLGNPSLLIQGYQYIISEKNKNGTSYWKCPKKAKGCRARVATRGHNHLKLGIHMHNHPPTFSMEKGNMALAPLPEFSDVKQNSVEGFDIKIVKQEPCDS